jgi:hypothetical protein
MRRVNARINVTLHGQSDARVARGETMNFAPKIATIIAACGTPMYFFYDHSFLLQSIGNKQLWLPSLIPHEKLHPK